MNNLTRISIVSTAETALKKLRKAEIGVYDCKKDSSRFIFSVKDKDIKKVFAIFAKPCYNVGVIGKSRRSRVLTSILNRIGLVAGAFIFIAAAAFSNLLVLKIDVEGSGNYLSPEVRRIVYECGAKEFGLYSGLDVPAATGKILSLPQVTFCNIEKRGSVLKVDVRVDEEHSGSVSASPLVSDRDGKVRNITAICGTPAVAAGSSVKCGDTLIAPYYVSEDKQTESLAVGYAELECSGSTEYFAEAETEESLKAAYASVKLYAQEILSRAHTVKPADGGVIYVIEFTYLHKLSINME